MYTNIKTKVMKIKDIEVAKYNPRKQLKPGDKEYEALNTSISNFGVVVPLIYNEATKTLISGHQRLNVLKNNGVTEVEVVVVNLPLSKEKALNIAMNKIDGKWDFDKLDELLSEIAVNLGDVKLTGFDWDALGTMSTMDRDSFFKGNNSKTKDRTKINIIVTFSNKDKAVAFANKLGYGQVEFNRFNKFVVDRLKGDKND